MVLDQVVEILVQFIEKINDMYQTGALSQDSYDQLTSLKIDFLSQHLHEITIYTLKSRCETLISTSNFHLSKSDILLH